MINSIKYQFIPREQALKLKELGFDEECLAAWTDTPKHLVEKQGKFWLRTHGNPFGHDIGRIFNSKLPKDMVAAPLWQQAFDFLHKKYGLYDTISESKLGGWFYYGPLKNEDVLSNGPFNNYEEARLACLNELISLVCLDRLIKIVKNEKV